MKLFVKLNNLSLKIILIPDIVIKIAYYIHIYRYLQMLDNELEIYIL